LPSQLTKPASQLARVQVLPVHAAAALANVQAWPPPPQLLGSVEVLVSQPLATLPSQLAKPGVQLATAQVPPVQAAVPLLMAPQAKPQVPQLLGSVAVLVSQPLAALPSQLAKPALQLATWQEPAMQAAVPLGAEQAVPQAPQLFASVCSFTQTPLHRVKPGWHAASVHTPAVHTCPL